MPANPTFPNPLLMAIATLVFASLIGFALAWPALRLQKTDFVGSDDGTEGTK
jgi:ABC-type branched-subunit amino acid transport system permease subunit